MATFTTATVIPNSRTPYSAVLDISNVTGGADNPLGTLTRTQLVALLLAGPLQALISRTADLTALNFAADSTKADFVRITRIEGGFDVSLIPPITVTLHFIADALEFSLHAGGEGHDLRMLVELRMVHSTDR